VYIRRGALRLSPNTVVMAFELAVAAKHDPTECRETIGERSTTPTKTLTFNASGAFSYEDGAALAQSIDDAISQEFHAYIICLQAVENIDNDALLTFAQWIRGRRDEGVDLRLCAVQPHIHHLLEEVGEAGDALMPLAQADTPRRKIEAYADVLKV
jgi:anti-anti-sigma regulatory factor